MFSLLSSSWCCKALQDSPSVLPQTPNHVDVLGASATLFVPHFSHHLEPAVLWRVAV
ncbi:unnamed protein product, partial [Lepidochelys olivacea]